MHRFRSFGLVQGSQHPGLVQESQSLGVVYGSQSHGILYGSCFTLVQGSHSAVRPLYHSNTRPFTEPPVTLQHRAAFRQRAVKPASAAWWHQRFVFWIAGTRVQLSHRRYQWPLTNDPYHMQGDAIYLLCSNVLLLAPPEEHRCPCTGC